MGEMDVKPQSQSQELSGTDFRAAVREAGPASFGVPGTGPTGVRSRSQSSQSEVTEGLGLRHWDLSDRRAPRLERLALDCVTP